MDKYCTWRLPSSPSLLAVDAAATDADAADVDADVAVDADATDAVEAVVKLHVVNLVML